MKNEFRNLVLQVVERERDATAQVLEYLKEVDLKKLYADWGYESLHAYCVRELKYSEGAAYRRIAAMRVLRQMPELKEKLESGAQTLTTLALVYKVNLPLSEKRELVDSFEGKSKRECERRLRAVAPEAIPRESTRILTPEVSELRVALSERVMGKLKRIRELDHGLAMDAGYAELIERMADQMLKKLDQKSTTSPARSTDKRRPNKGTEVFVKNRDGGKCTHPGCESTWRLQLDHVQPYALGGETSVENLRLLCPTHNQMYARRAGLMPPSKIEERI